MIQLRPELSLPQLDETLVARLAWLAANLDGAQDPAQSARWIEEFNAKAGTRLDYFEFQGIYGGQPHEEWAKAVLLEPFCRRVEDISRAELIDLVSRVLSAQGREHEASFYLGVLRANLPDVNVSDLIYWPDVYLGDGHSTLQMTPEEIVDVALAMQAKAPPPIELPPSSIL